MIQTGSAVIKFFFMIRPTMSAAAFSTIADQLATTSINFVRVQGDIAVVTYKNGVTEEFRGAGRDPEADFASFLGKLERAGYPVQR